MTNETEQPNDDPNAPQYGDTVTTGPLLEEPDLTKVVQWLHDDWVAQKDRYARRLCEAQVNRRRRTGEGNIWAERTEENRAAYRIYETHGAKQLNQFYQKANRLCLRTVAVLHTDPPEPDAIPTTGESEDRDAAEFTTRVLKDINSESGLNQLEAHKQAWDWASNGGSAYIWTYTDPYGGGRQPIEVDANPQAQHVDQAMQQVDPMTGQVSDYTGPTVPKYVGPDGTLSDKKGQAAKRWVPKLAREVVDFGSVRLLPATATDIWDATGLLYANYHSWGTLKGWFDELAQASDEDRDEAIKFRLPECQHLLPQRGNKPYSPTPKPGHEDEGLALLMIKWCVEGPDYPEGAYIVTVGKSLVPHRGPWHIENPDGTTERRDIPLTQVMQFRGDQDTPAGWGLMDFLGPSNENRGEINGQVLDMLDKLLNPKILLPLGSTLQPQDFESPFNTTLRFQPGYEPKQMEGPKIPAEAFKMMESIDLDMNDATGMGQASAQGLEQPNVNSGRHALAIQSAQTASLSDLNQNVNRAFVRDWRIQCQTIKADFEIPQLVRFIDKDGDYKAKKWRGSDFGSTRDVQIRKGTGTLFNSAQKAQFYAEFQQTTQGDIADLQENIASGFSPYISLQDDSHLMRIRRQIAQWEAGPPAGWMPPPPMPPPQVLGVDSTGQPVTAPPAPPPPFDPVFGADQRLVDLTPVAAGKRIRELGLTMSGTKYGTIRQQNSAWASALDQEFQRMQQAMAPPPMPMAAPGKPAASSSDQPSLSPAEQQAAGQ